MTDDRAPQLKAIVGPLRYGVTDSRHMLTNYSLRHLLILAITCWALTGCNPRELPGFKQVAKSEEARLTRETDEAVKKSPDLQQLDHLCMKEIPLFDGFALLARHASPSSTTLTYYYRSGADYPKVKDFYIRYFSQAGWRLARQKENGWGPDELVFRKEAHEIIISHGGLGDAEYAMDCQKLSDSGEARPNKALQMTAR